MIYSTFRITVRRVLQITTLCFLILGTAWTANAQEDIDVGETGWKTKRPVVASACANGCPWGELGDFIQEAMKPLGYSVIICRNCNRYHGPRLVSNSSYPPPLDDFNIEDGLNFRIDAPVDFGITSSAMLYNAYKNESGGGPFKNLRLLAKIEDPYYFLAAINNKSGIESIEQIKEQKLSVRFYGFGADIERVLKYNGITKEDILAWGGKIDVTREEAEAGEFDIMSGFLATPAMNPESDQWTVISQRYDLHFLEFPDDLRKEIAANSVDAELVVAHQSMLRGMNKKIRTVGRSGESFFIRDDAPEQAAYDIAKAIDESHGLLKWYIRIYTYDPNTVWQNFGVPLHPGAERYYREQWYMK